MKSIEEITPIKNVISEMGFTLDEDQPHMSGERFLMTRNKLVLIGKDKNKNKVIMKVADHFDGQNEIRREKKARDILTSLSFAKEVLLFPKEIFYGKKDSFLFFITEYISQDKVFVEHTLEEQFFMALRAFEAQESFHATTFEHLKKVSDVFPVFKARDYFESFASFQKSILSKHSDGILEELLSKALIFLTEKKATLDLFSNHLVHTDFVPHNFRVNGKKMYMLDAAAVQFGNKYEGWARFLNYMVIHNPELERLLVEYIKTNRSQEEYFNLRLMRVYKLGYLLDYYISSLNKTSGDLHELTKKRIAFWHSVLESVMEDMPVKKETVEEYRNKRDDLRSDEEKERQKEFAVA